MAGIARLFIAGAIVAYLTDSTVAATNPQTTEIDMAAPQAGTVSTPISPVESEQPSLPTSSPVLSSSRTLTAVPRVPKGAEGPGRLNAFAKRLTDSGISFHLLYAQGSVFSGSAGISPNRAGTSGFLIPSLDFDLGRLVGVRGGRIHLEEALFLLRSGTGIPSGFQSQIGDTLLAAAFQNNPRPNTLSVVTYEQDLLDGRLQFEGGRTNMFRYFDLPNNGNFIFGPDPVLQFDAPILPPPFATWGGRTSYKLGSGLFFQTGAGEVNQGQILKHGFDWTTRGATGVNVLGEVGYKSTFATFRYPSNGEIGGFYDTAPSVDPRASLPAPFGAARAQADQDDGGLFLRVTQTVWNPISVGRSAPFSEGRHVDIYGTASVAFDTNQPIGNFASVGLTLYSPVGNRPFDKVSIEASHLTVSQKWRSFETNARALSGGVNVGTNPNEYRFSVYTQVALGPLMVLQPSVGYLVNPDTFQNIGSPRVPRDGVFASLSLLVFLGTALGFPPPGQ